MFFGTASDELRAVALPMLSEVAQLSGGLSGSEIEIRGHTDRRGAFGYNHELSLRRAEAVARFLRRLGIPSALIRVRAHGEELASGAEAEDVEADRRVDIVLIPERCTAPVRARPATTAGCSGSTTARDLRCNPI